MPACHVMIIFRFYDDPVKWTVECCTLESPLISALMLRRECGRAMSRGRCLRAPFVGHFQLLTYIIRPIKLSSQRTHNDDEFESENKHSLDNTFIFQLAREYPGRDSRNNGHVATELLHGCNQRHHRAHTTHQADSSKWLQSNRFTFSKQNLVRTMPTSSTNPFLLLEHPVSKS